MSLRSKNSSLFLPRWVGLGLCATTMLVLLGCWKPTARMAKVESDATYPLRTGWLVVNTPKGAPRGPSAGNLSPLNWLQIPTEQRVGDQKLLDSEVRSGNILNARKFDHFPEELLPKLVPGLETGMRQVFGTQAAPHVVPGKEQLDKHLNELAALKKTADEATIEFVETAIKTMKTLVSDSAQADGWVNELQVETNQLTMGRSLYQTYCQQCHGETGGGDGPAGVGLSPAPRDYRSGIFKFISAKTTAQGVRPRRADLHRTITNGLDGAGMPAFTVLTTPQIEAITSYVIFLSIRGEAEFRLLKRFCNENEICDPVTITADLASEAKKILEIWSECDRSPIPVDPNPYTTRESQIQAAIAGAKLFNDAKQGACASCHINYGQDAPYQFDAWAGILKPRNFKLGTFRVGSAPEEIYTRVYCGIPGAGMPSHLHLLPTPEEKEANTSRIWQIVWFIRALSQPEQREELRRAGIPLE
ncbi:MAG: c-type cytochrome [Zavarzinella sp.]